MIYIQNGPAWRPKVLEILNKNLVDGIIWDPREETFEKVNEIVSKGYGMDVAFRYVVRGEIPIKSIVMVNPKQYVKTNKKGFVRVGHHETFSRCWWWSPTKVFEIEQSRAVKRSNDNSPALL